MNGSREQVMGGRLHRRSELTVNAVSDGRDKPSKVRSSPTALQVNASFSALVVAHACLWAVLAWTNSVPFIRDGLPRFYASVFSFFFVWYTLIGAVVLRMRARQGATIPNRKELLSRGLLAFWAFAAVAALGVTFTSAKVAIPQLSPFHWDAPLAHLDRLVHGGVEPWVLLHAFLGRPQITIALAFVYSPIWFAVVAVFLGWIAWHSDQVLRLRFLLSWTLTWILLGNVAATILSSAGPAYYPEVVSGPNPFAGLMDYLSTAAPSLVLAQQNLWAAQMGNASASATALGISAAPSLHVATPALFAIITWSRSRQLSATLWAYTLLQLITTVHLGWHYAVDGYMGILGAAGVVWVVDRLIAFWPGQHALLR